MPSFKTTEKMKYENSELSLNYPYQSIFLVLHRSRSAYVFISTKNSPFFFLSLEYFQADIFYALCDTWIK